VSAWAKPGTPLFHIAIEPTFVVSGRDPDPRSSNRIAELTDSSWFEGMHVVAFAGIARPHRLTKDLRRLGAEVVSFEPYPDHHVYTSDEIQRLLGKVRDLAPDAFVTTEKDLERLRGTPFHEQLIEKGLLALRVEATLAAREMDAFRRMVLRAARGGIDSGRGGTVEGSR
jgi:tetraacyldisaccharide-1-P 4'-kinase